MLDNFILYLTTEKRYSQHTIDAYERDLTQFINYAEVKKIIEFNEFSSTFIRGWIVQLFEEKRNYSSSLQISLSDLNNKGLEDGTNREYISYMEKIYITFVTLGFK